MLALGQKISNREKNPQNAYFCDANVHAPPKKIHATSFQNYGGLEIRRELTRKPNSAKLCVVKDITSTSSHVEFEPIPVIGAASAALQSFNLETAVCPVQSPFSKIQLRQVDGHRKTNKRSRFRPFSRNFQFFRKFREIGSEMTENGLF